MTKQEAFNTGPPPGEPWTSSRFSRSFQACRRSRNRAWQTV